MTKLHSSEGDKTTVGAENNEIVFEKLNKENSIHLNFPRTIKILCENSIIDSS